MIPIVGFASSTIFGLKMILSLFSTAIVTDATVESTNGLVLFNPVRPSIRPVIDEEFQLESASIRTFTDELSVSVGSEDSIRSEPNSEPETLVNGVTAYAETGFISGEFFYFATMTVSVFQVGQVQ